MIIMYNKLQNCLASVRKFTDFEPDVALILGSGLGDFADNKVDVVTRVSYADIEGFPQSTVSGHAGQFVFGYVGDVKVVIMQGRVHYYEGYQMSDVVLPTRLMKMMGAKKLFLTNAAGGCNPNFVPGDLMIITDHISSFVPSPLIGKNIDEFGARFPGMSEVYNKELRALVKEKAAELGVKVQEGVYVQFTGPNYETPSEVQLGYKLGGSAIGMSTAVEAMVANHMGMDIVGISCITNMCSGMQEQELSHEEVKETADRVAVDFQNLVEAVIKNM